ncbi:peroxynitrite isomerase THAP4-like isoform X2 [Festucalex cinctus]
MPCRCVAGFCSNRREDGVSLFRFPRDVGLHEKWTKQVQRTREKWTPTPTSVLCSAHFEEESFDPLPALKQSLGYNVQHKRVLLPTAVPTLFPKSNQKGTTPTATAPVAKHQPAAILKRGRKLVVDDDMLMEYESKETATQATCLEDDLGDVSGVCIQNQKEASCQALPSTRTVADSIRAEGHKKDIGKKYLRPEQQELKSPQVKKEEEHPYFKEEKPILRVKEEEVEDDITKSPMTFAPLKSEDEDEACYGQSPVPSYGAAARAQGG